MSRYDFRSPRVYVNQTLAPRAMIALDRGQANYLVNVLRLRADASVLVFNGRDGEWRGTLALDRRKATLKVAEQTRAQTEGGDLHLLFAPLKYARLDYLVQKAVEMGASRLRPVMTRHVQASRLNLARMRANAIEAAEQCGILTLPEVAAPIGFDRIGEACGSGRLLVFCDEDAEIGDPVAALAARRGAAKGAPLPLAVLTGPEGGFAPEERAALLRLPNVVRLSLGPRILRADTAAVAALAVVQAVLGDWR
jgi:16S rRNA (uracil1498-N3)-methyltransferase